MVWKSSVYNDMPPHKQFYYEPILIAEHQTWQPLRKGWNIYIGLSQALYALPPIIADKSLAQANFDGSE